MRRPLLLPPRRHDQSEPQAQPRYPLLPRQLARLVIMWALHLRPGHLRRRVARSRRVSGRISAAEHGVDGQFVSVLELNESLQDFGFLQQYFFVDGEQPLQILLQLQLPLQVVDVVVSLRPAPELEPALLRQRGELRGSQQRLLQQRGVQRHELAVPATHVPLAVLLSDLDCVLHVLVHQGGTQDYDRRTQARRAAGTVQHVGRPGDPLPLPPSAAEAPRTRGTYRFVAKH
mmetsp:Transcript_18287/g.30502  ORF Transcript_18287/g.30502 Transcript_18287/m.30502 type:complete len:231 (-) Transcript_18287:147-839(-)